MGIRRADQLAAACPEALTATFGGPPPLPFSAERIDSGPRLPSGRRSRTRRRSVEMELAPGRRKSYLVLSDSSSELLEICNNSFRNKFRKQYLS